MSPLRSTATPQGSGTPQVPGSGRPRAAWAIGSWVLAGVLGAGAALGGTAQATPQTQSADAAARALKLSGLGPVQERPAPSQGGGRGAPGPAGAPPAPAGAGPEAAPGSLGSSGAPAGPGAAPSAAPAPPVPLFPSPAGDPLSRHPWATWWELERPNRVHAREALRRGGATTGSADFFLGQDSQGARPAEARRVPTRILKEEVVPALLRELSRSGGPEPVVDSLLALGRIAPVLSSQEFAPVHEALRQHVGAANRPVAEAATIALGWTAQDAALFTLAALVADGSAGRELTGGEVPERVRAFGAYGLGFLARHTTREDVRRFAVSTLAREMDRLDRSQPDLAVAVQLAMGLVPLERIHSSDPGGVPEPVSSSRIAVVRKLGDWLNARRGPRADVRPFAASALGRMVSDLPAARVEELKAWFAEPLRALAPRNRRESPESGRALMRALGELVDSDGDPLDEALGALLVDSAEDGDVLVRYEAYLALARAASRPGQGANPGRWSETYLEPVWNEVSRGRANGRPFAATGLALAAGALRGRGEEPPAPWGAALSDALERSRGPEDLVAAAVGLGLAGDRSHVGSMQAALSKAPRGWERAQLAIALGLVGDPGSRTLLRAYAEEARQMPAELAAATQALVLCGDQAFSLELVGRLDSLGGQELEAAILALGTVGEPAAVNPLLAQLRRPDATASVRAVVVRALGLIGDPRDVCVAASLASHAVPWNAPTSLVRPVTFFDSWSRSDALSPLLRGGGLLNLIH